MLLAAAFGIGLLSAFCTSFIGGAMGMIAVPLFLLIGLPTYTAVALPKFGALGIAIGSLFKFHGKNLIKWSLIPVLMVLAAIAGLVGAQALLATPEYIVENIVIVLLLISTATLWSKKDMGIVGFATSKLRQFLGYIAYFLSEGFRAAFGSGFGTLANASLTYFFGLTNLESMATKRLPGVVVTLVALTVFIIQGVMDIPMGISMFVGSIVGGYVGTHYAIKIGNKWLKYLFTAFALVMVIALLIF